MDSFHSVAVLKVAFFFVFVFWIIILYRNRIYYMYCALREVVRGEEGGIKARDKALQC
jgi:hypothetical protein